MRRVLDRGEADTSSTAGMSCSDLGRDRVRTFAPPLHRMMLNDSRHPPTSRPSRELPPPLAPDRGTTPREDAPRGHSDGKCGSVGGSGGKGWRYLLAATCAIVVVGQSLPWAAPPSPRPGGPRKFFESLLGRPAGPEPAFIAAPTPPGPESVPELERLAVASRPGATRAVTPAKPAVAEPAAPTRLPTWDEAVGFASGVGTAARQVASNAVDPTYKPAPAASRVRPRAVATTVAAKPPAALAVLPPSGAPAPRTPRFERLRSKIAQTLAAYQKRPLNTAHHTPWEVMHGFIAFGIPTRVRVGGPAGDPVNAIGWMNTGGRCHGQVMLAASGDRLTALRGIGVQGHSAQYLAILAQCRVALNSPITVQSKSFTVADLVKEEQLACKSGTELTFALIGLAHYLPTDTTWEARDGKAWSLEKLVAEELEQPIRGAPCGGTHRLFGLAYACQRRLRATGTLDGVYLRADRFVRDYQQFALTKLQNRDGSFSTEWFKYPADRDDDIDRKIQTTGHILEWLVASLDQEELFQPRVTAAVEFLSAALAREPGREWKIGPMGHALHALTIYQERAWGTVLPGGIAAFHGGMKPPPAAQLAEVPAEGDEPGRDRSSRR